MSTPLRRLRRRATSDLVVLILGMFIMGFSVFAIVRDSQYVACQRGSQDRFDNAQAWRQAYVARNAAAVKSGDPIDAEAARQYLRTVTSLESRTRPTAEGRAKLCRMLLPRWPWQ